MDPPKLVDEDFRLKKKKKNIDLENLLTLFLNNPLKCKIILKVQYS